jgi:hypothetical protein
MYNVGDILRHVVLNAYIMITFKELSTTIMTREQSYHYNFVYLHTWREDAAFESYLDNAYILEA